MKIRNIISATLMGVVLASTPTFADYSIGAIVTANYLNVRKYPSTDSTIVDVLPKGTYVEAFDSGNPDWNKINFGDYVGYVYNAYLTGDDDPVPISARMESGMRPTTSPTQVVEGTPKEEENLQNKLNDTSLTQVIALDDFRKAGIVKWNNWSWTYYTMSMFPGSTSTPCPDRWVNDEGFVCDPDGYIILASADLAPYTMVETPFGHMGKVYDTGCPSGILDVYTNW